MGEFSLRKLASRVKKWKLTDRCVIAICSDSPLASQDNLKDFIAVIEQTQLKDIVIAIVDELNEFSVINETEMNKRGWFKIDHLAKIIKE